MIINKKYILFDLDGTLTDPKIGICTCVQYALKEFGIEEPNLDKLTPFIGPPLKDSFMQYYGFSEEDAATAIEKYRERFSETGKFENEVYKGIPELLRDLKNYGYHLAVASSKPECFVKEILEHFNIAQYFEVVAGSELDGTRTDKAEVIHEALNRLFHYGQIKKDQIIMIGDRKFDIQGAREIGVSSIAVGYGYGSAEELNEAEPDYLADNVAELRTLLIDDEELKKKNEEAAKKAAAPKLTNLQQAQQKAAKKNPMSLVWKFLFPFLLFYFAGELFRQLFGFVLMFMAEQSEALYNFMFVAEDSNEEMLALSGNGNAVIQILALCSVFIVLYKMGGGKESLEKSKKTARKYSAAEWGAWLAVSLLVAAGLNMVLAATGLLSSSESYQETASNLYAVGIPLGLVLYGIFSPLTEELLFRGIIFTQVKTYMKPLGAALLSSALFGAYHGNSIQLVYSFVLGIVLAYAYHYSGSFIVPLVLHGIVNICVFLASSFGLLRGDTIQLVLGIVCLVLGVVLFFFMYKKYQKQEQAEASTAK